MTNFCNPVEHAIVMIDVCGSLDAARAQAQDNSDTALTGHDSLYWLSVAQALTPGEVIA